MSKNKVINTKTDQITYAIVNNKQEVVYSPILSFLVLTDSKTDGGNTDKWWLCAHALFHLGGGVV